MQPPAPISLSLGSWLAKVLEGRLAARQPFPVPDPSQELLGQRQLLLLPAVSFRAEEPSPALLKIAVAA